MVNIGKEIIDDRAEMIKTGIIAANWGPKIVEDYLSSIIQYEDYVTIILNIQNEAIRRCGMSNTHHKIKVRETMNVAISNLVYATLSDVIMSLVIASEKGIFEETAISIGYESMERYRSAIRLVRGAKREKFERLIYDASNITLKNKLDSLAAIVELTGDKLEEKLKTISFSEIDHLRQQLSSPEEFEDRLEDESIADYKRKLFILSTMFKKYSISVLEKLSNARMQGTLETEVQNYSKMTIKGIMHSISMAQYLQYNNLLNVVLKMIETAEKETRQEGDKRINLQLDHPENK
ncbi:MAG TPA: hypothetical protein DCY94_03860 [Firmicutes bacterium]|nr:hypothetical protein [Bacillota bacterium]